MTESPDLDSEIFSYHLIQLSFFKMLRLFFAPPKVKNISGLNFSLCLFTMKLGHPVFSFSRYNLTTLAFIARWKDEASLDQFIQNKKSNFLKSETWSVRLKPYRQWGHYEGLNDLSLTDTQKPKGPIIGLTVAKLRLTQVFRFARWGKPVEKQVHKSKGKMYAAVSMRPLLYFSTFSLWKTEEDMLSMVIGHKETKEGMNHSLAMKERAQRPFHHEFTTIRFIPLKLNESSILKN